MKHLLIFISLIYLINNWTNGQSLKTGDFYRFDTLEIIKKIPYDSIRFNLEYAELGNDSLWFAILPMFSNRPNQFGFLSDTHKFSYTRIIKNDSGFISNLIFTNNFAGEITNETKLLEKKHVTIISADDSTMIINNNVFKIDKGLKIFKLFTGY